MEMIELISAIIGLILIIEFFFLCRNVSEIKYILSSKSNGPIKLREKVLEEDEEKED